MHSTSGSQRQGSCHVMDIILLFTKLLQQIYAFLCCNKLTSGVQQENTWRTPTCPECSSASHIRRQPSGPCDSTARIISTGCERQSASYSSCACYNVQCDERIGTIVFAGTMYADIFCHYACRSMLLSPWGSCGGTDKTTTWHVSILCRWSCRLERSTNWHSNCIDTCKL